MTNAITAELIKKKREDNRLTQSEMAELLGVSPSAVHHWEHDGRGLETGTTKYALLKLFEELDYLNSSINPKYKGLLRYHSGIVSSEESEDVPEFGYFYICNPNKEILVSLKPNIIKLLPNHTIIETTKTVEELVKFKVRMGYEVPKSNILSQWFREGNFYICLKGSLI